ncbi:MAG: transposase [candidate division Zixibacteria bacterium]|nr:transposase [candidate division Zixibacteria bacterium]
MNYNHLFMTSMELPRKHFIRFSDPGHAHALTFSCNQRLPLLSRDRTRMWLVDALEAARLKYRFAILAYVIMPEHVHLLVYPREEGYDVSAFLKAVKQAVSRKAKHFLAREDPEWLQRLSVRTPEGKVFRFWQQGPGFDSNITSMEALRREIEYIHYNPVRRGLVDVPRAWPWSSAGSPEAGSGRKLIVDPIDGIFPRGSDSAETERGGPSDGQKDTDKE